jgi:HD-GYP domain-containing protein (c-di-GMP phosphodiesterase class II)
MGVSRITLCGVGPDLEGRWWVADQEFRIGSAPDVKVVLRDPSVGGCHAEVRATECGWVLFDLGSREGTFVNELGVPPEGQPLRLQDVIRCGGLSVQVAALEGPGQPTLKTSSALLRVQGVIHRSWEQALQTWARQEGYRLAQGKHLLTLLRAGYLFSSGAPLDEWLQAILEDTVAELGAQRGCFVLADEATGELCLRTVTVRGPGVSSLKCYSKTLARRCFERGESLLCQDVNREDDFQVARSGKFHNMASILCLLLRSPRKPLGVLHLDRGPLQPPFTEADFFLADGLAASLSAAIESARLVAEHRELFLQTVAALARAVEIRDRYTGDHTQRVTDYALLLGQEVGLSAAELYHLRIGTPLHDVGKIGIADAILQKPGHLTAEEFEEMKTHTVKGATILSAIPGLGPLVPIVRHHHERWDGRGYPDHLGGEDIDRLARVVAVADAFDAMTSERPYRPALSPDDAFAEIRDKAGTHFAPDCARAFLRLRPAIEALKNRPAG